MTESLVTAAILMALGSVLLKGYLAKNVERYKNELADMNAEKQRTASLLRQTEAVLATVNDKERDLLRHKKKAAAELAQFERSGDGAVDASADSTEQDNETSQEEPEQAEEPPES